MEKMILAIVNSKGKREFNYLKKEFLKDGWCDFSNNTFIKFLSIESDEQIYIKKIENYKFSKCILIVPVNKEAYKNISTIFSTNKI